MQIEAKHINRTIEAFGETLTILQDISLRIESGESLAITGVSGSGKSTLLNLLAGLDLPTQGQIWWNGTDIVQLKEDERAQLRQGRMGFVFQNFQLIPGLSALDNVLLPLELCGKADSLTHAKTALSGVGLTQRMLHTPNELSGGEQQRVALARAYALEPEILFADEPTGNLDFHTAQQMIELIFALHQQHRTTLVCVTHDDHLAGRCKRVLKLQAGQLQPC